MGMVALAITMTTGCPARAGAPAESAGLPKLTLYKDDRGNEIRFLLGAQLQMEFKSKDMGSSADNLNTTVMRLRSARPFVTGTMLDGRLARKLQLNVVPGTLELLDLKFDYKFKPDGQLRYGVFKMPFTHYRMASKLRLQQIDWAVTSRYFGGERQWGFALHNGYENPPRWGYVVAVGTGENSRASHGKGIALAYDRALPNPSDLAGEGGGAEFHPEIFGNLSFNSPGIDISSETDRQRSGLRYSFALSGAWDMDPEYTIDFSYRAAPEILLKYRGWCVTGVGYAGWSEMGDGRSDRLAMRGGVLHLAYRWCDRYEVAVRYAAVAMTEGLKQDVRSWSLREGSDVSDYVWDLKEDYAIVFNIYFIEHQLKLQNGVQLLTPRVGRTDILATSQFQLWF